MERRKMENKIEITHEVTIGSETEVGIIFGDGTKRTVKIPYETYAPQRLGTYKRI